MELRTYVPSQRRNLDNLHQVAVRIHAHTLHPGTLESFPVTVAEKILQSARAMDSSGLSDYGWCYVNIDDGWQGLRGGKYNGIQPNKKFPDMKALGDSLHARAGSSSAFILAHGAPLTPHT